MKNDLIKLSPLEIDLYNSKKKQIVDTQIFQKKL